MPELSSPFGYPAVLAVVAAVCAYLYYRFRRAGWF
jgi:magnesium transporter